MKNQKKLFFIALVFLNMLLSDSIFSQPQTEWVRQFNSSSNNNDHVNDMKIDEFGNIYLCGYVLYSVNSTDVLVIKYDRNGNLLWSRTWNGTGTSLSADGASKIQFDDSGYVYVLGNTFANPTYGDFLLMKYTPNGDTVWVRTFDGMNQDSDDATDMIIDKNNNIYITGLLYRFANIDNGTIKYDRDGNLEWERKFELFSSGKILTDSSYIYVCGYSYISQINIDDIAILKYDTLGNFIDTFYCGTNHLDGADLMVFDLQKNLILAGLEDAGLPTQYNIITTKISQDGIKNWLEIFNNNFDNSPEYLYDLKVDKNNNIYVLARSRNIQNLRDDIALIKYDNITGDSIWTRKYNLVPFSNEEPSKMSIDKDNNIYVIETSDSSVIFSRIVTIKYNSLGQLQWHKVYYPSVFSNSYSACILTDTLGNIYASGMTNSQQTGGDIVLIKYSQLTNVIESNTNIPEKYELYQNFPNPFNSQTEIKFDLIKNGNYKMELYDMLGKRIDVILNEYKNAGSYKINYNAFKLSSGMYFYKLSSPEINIIKKFVLIK
jgi:hypothetical protein